MQRFASDSVRWASTLPLVIVLGTTGCTSTVTGAGGGSSSSAGPGSSSVDASSTGTGSMAACMDVQPSSVASVGVSVAASSGSGMDPNCVQGEHQCSAGEGCNCPPEGVEPVCGCDAKILNPTPCGFYDRASDPALCGAATFPCGDTTCKRGVEYCAPGPAGSSGYAQCLPTPASCSHGIAGCNCLSLQPGELCRTDLDGAVTVGCVCATAPQAGCGTDGSCDAAGQCRLWDTSAACTGCGGSGTCNAVGNCDVPDGTCATGFCWLGACVTLAGVGVGGGHTCAITSAGGVECLGANYAGALGNGTTTPSAVPVPVTSLSSGVVAVVGGGGHTCALTTGGTVKCWGDGYFGALGNGSLAPGLVPTDVAQLSGVTAITAGGSNSCALTASGEVWCWGDDGYGQVGNCANGKALVPSQVIALPESVVSVSAGGYRTCAVTASGSVYCWGFLGSDASTLAFSAAPVGLAPTAASIVVGGAHTCIVTTAGGVACWDDATGSNKITDQAPVPVAGLSSGVASIAIGASHSCALTTSGGVQCWGANDVGQLGNGQTEMSPTPVPVTGLSSGVVAISAGAGSTCALTAAGRVKCWGASFDGSGTPVPVPTDLPEP
jgi:hypothetical protein